MALKQRSNLDSYLENVVWKKTDSGYNIFFKISE